MPIGGMGAILGGLGALLGEEFLQAFAKEGVERSFDTVSGKNGPKPPQQIQIVPGPGQGMAPILGAMPQGPQQSQFTPQPQQGPGAGTKLRRGIGDALMSIGAIGLGQDPFSVMQNQRQSRADAEQTEVQNRRADEQMNMAKDRFEMEKAQNAQDQATRQANRDFMKAVIAGNFPEETAKTMQAAQVLGGQQSPQGMGGAMQPPQGGMGGILSSPNITPEERQLLLMYAQGDNQEAFVKALPEFLQSPPEQPKNVDIEDGYILTPEGPQPIPGYVEREAQLRKAGASNTNINMSPQETEFDKTVGKTLAEEFVGLQERGASARTEAQQYRVLGDLLKQTYTGAGGQTVLQMKKVAQALGIEGVEGIGEAEAAQKISRELALKLRNPESGAGMPGQLSNADRDFLESMVPGLANSPQGNQMMVEYMIRLSNRKAEISALGEQYAAEHGGRLDAGWYKFQREFVEQSPIFNEQDMAQAQQAATAAAPAKPNSDGSGGGVNWTFDENGNLSQQ